MKVLRNLLDEVGKYCDRGTRFQWLFPLYEAIDNFFYSPGTVTPKGPHVRDSMDLKRMMIIVVIALIPCVFMAVFNTGLQANRAVGNMGLSEIGGWRGQVFSMSGFEYDATSLVSNMVVGLLFFLPVYFVSMLVGGLWETAFSIVRRHPINEGFLVTGLLFPLTLPPTIPLWQVAIGISFGVVIGKEVFGGTGRNFLNPALTARAFLYFAYPAQNSGDSVWTAVDGFSGATPLGALATTDVETGLSAVEVSWSEAFLGTIQGSMGETSTLACIIGACLLVFSGIGSWRIMISMLAGGVLTTLLFNLIGSTTNPMFLMNPAWHLVTGGFAFGMVFMATDPVSAAMTDTGRWIYGFFIGSVSILIRVVNPAYPEGIMLAILLGNVFAPVMDFFVVQANIKRRKARCVTG